ncbi:MAG: D-sedoheptulose 7-phosphate isomerase [Candidatus Acidiferrum sp.]|jgi:D-sedoheptulose 7-phosphate isomerase
MPTPAVAGAEALVRENVVASIAVHEAILRDVNLLRGIAEAGKKIAEAMRQGHRLLLMGNGGSAADAQHIAAEFVGRYRKERRALPAMALTGNTSALTAISNDYGFEDVFARQVEAFAQPGDVLIGISTSGKSRNVAKALLLASAMQVTTVAMTGENGGVLKSAVDLCLCVPSGDTPRIQEGHILAGHAMADIVERELFDVR